MYWSNLFAVIAWVLLSVLMPTDGVIRRLEYIDLFPKRHRLVHNGRFPKFKALYCSLNMISSTEIS